MPDTADPYLVLGVDRGADAEQIRRAFRRLIVRSHPDRSRDPDAADRAAAIITAYRTLAHPERRRKIDRRRSDQPIAPGAERRRQVRRAADRDARTRKGRTTIWIRDAVWAAAAIAIVAHVLGPDLRAYQRDRGDSAAIAAAAPPPAG